MKKGYLILFLLICFSSFAQIEAPAFFKSGVQEVPENYGSKEELKRFFDCHLIYPKNSLKKKMEGTVDIKYTCSEKGTILSYTVLKSPDKEIEAEAIRLFRLLLFKPAYKNGKAIEYEHYISIPFNISKYKKSLKRRDRSNTNKLKLPLDTSFIIHEKVEKQAAFIYGNDSLPGYIYSELEYPEEAKLKNIEGTVVISFIIEPSGFISNINVEKSVGGGCQEEAIRVISQTKWKPGQVNNKLVRSKMTYSVVFRLNNQFKDNSQGSQRVGGY